MEPLSAYLPADRRLALVRGDALPDRSTGAVLFADISGFTPLSEALARELGAQRGAEEMIRQLNRVFGDVIRQVDQHAGSVIDFSGDAITCWLEGDDGLRAAACALAMQQAMRSFTTVRTPSGTPIALAVKVSAVHGPVRRFLVGDPDLRVFEVLAGRTLDRFAAADHLVRKGEVLVDADIVDRHRARLSVAEWREEAGGARFAVVDRLQATVAPTPWPPHRLADAAARPWLLPAVYERLLGGVERFLAELRSAVAMFVSFGGIDYDGDDAAGEKLDAYVRWAQRVVDRYDGAFLQLSFGDKGSYAYICFGAPIAHEDDAERAVATALELRRPPPTLHYIDDVRIGLSLGQMRTGAYGGPTRRTYGVLGSEANIASRLMQRAEPGQVLVTQRVARAAAGFAHQPAGSARLKGLTEPIALFEVRGRAAAPGAAPAGAAPIVGRQAERRALAECLDGLCADRASSVAILEGEAGVGKSRLVADLLDQARARGVRVLLGAADAIERATPYYAWRAILNRALDIDGLSEPAARRDRIASLLASDARRREWTPLLSDVLQLEMADNATTAQMSGQVRADNLQELLTAMLTIALGDGPNWRPTLVVLEDAHWMDSTSWALLARAVDALPPMMIALATRPLAEPIPAEFRSLAGRADARRLSLDALPAEDIDALIARRLGVRSLPQPVRDVIRDKAEGHPFFSEELAFAMRDAGLIQIVNGECRVAPNVGALSEMDFPSTIQGVITSRIDRLAPQPQLTLKVASIIGRVFAYPILRDIHPAAAERDRLPGDLQTLERLDIALLDAPEPEPVYLFKHIITQEVAYSLMLFRQRRELHRAAAEWYERRHADNPAPFYPLLAHHWTQAAEDDTAAPVIRFKAIDYLDRAGEQALQSSAYKESIAFFERAFSLEGPEAGPDGGGRPSRDVLRRARRHLKLGEAQRSWGHLAEYRRSFERAAALYGFPAPTGRLKTAIGVIGQLGRQLLHRLQPRRFVGRAPQEDRPLLLEAALVYQFLSEIFYFTNEGLRNLYSSLLTLNLSERAGTSRELAEAYAVMGILTGSLGMRGQAEAYFGRATDTARDTRQELVAAHVVMLRSLYHLETAQWARAQADLPRAIETLDRLGDRRYWGDSTTMLASAAAFTGDYAEANRLFAEIAGPRSGSLIHRTTAAVWQGRVALLQGRLDDAVELLNAALALTADSADPLTMVYTRINAWSFLGATHARRQEWEPALRAAEEATRLIALQRAGAAQLNLAFVHLADVYLALWETGADGLDRRRHAGEARRLCRAMRMTRFAARARALRCQGVCDRLAGRAARASDNLRASLKLSRQLSLPYEEAQAHYELGRRLPEDDAERRDHLARARDIFARIGAAHDLALVEAELAGRGRGSA